jgi:hypothetical protein
MAYSAWSVIAGEQPTTSKWNILGTNDASFNDGTGIATNAITGAKLATNAIKLGYAAKTSSQTGITSEVDITSLSAGVTVPAGGRDVRITVHFSDIVTSANGQRATITIKESTTPLGAIYKWLPSTSGGNGCDFGVVLSAPSAGAHTYKATISRSVGAGTIDVYAGAAPEHAWILVEAI